MEDMVNEVPRSIPVFRAPEGGQLSEEMLSAFETTGVIILEDFVSVESCDELRKRTEELVAAMDPGEAGSVFSTTGQEQLNDRYFIESGDKIRFFFEAGAFGEDGELIAGRMESLNKMGHAMHDLDPVFDRFSRTPALGEVVRRLGFRDPVIIQSMVIFKPPRIGGEVVCHQDSTYIYTEPESCTGFWFALEDATTENGCMYFIPGAHRGPLRARNYRIGPFELTTEVIDPEPWPEEHRLPAEASAGSLVIFHGRTPHISEPNRSDDSRHAYTLHVIDRACHYPAENWLQRADDLPLRGFA